MRVPFQLAFVKTIGLFRNPAAATRAAALLLDAHMFGAATVALEVATSGVVTAHIGGGVSGGVVGCDVAHPFTAAVTAADGVLFAGVVYFHTAQTALTALVVAAILLRTVQI